MLCGVCGFDGVRGGVVEDAVPDSTEALFGQDASLSLRYVQHMCRAKLGLATRAALKCVFSAHRSIWTSLSTRAFPFVSCKNIEIRAEDGETRSRMHLNVRAGWCCGGVVQRGRGCRRGCTVLRGERGCLPDRCRAPQDGWTPLHHAAYEGRAAVVEQLLAAKADVAAKNNVRGAGVDARRG